MGKEIRGSEKLRTRYTEQDLAELLEVVSADDRLVIEDGFPYGIPAVDGATIFVRTSPEGAVEFLSKAMRLSKPPQVLVGPKGIPPAEAFVELRITAGAQRQL